MKKAFTLLELLVVIVIIGIIASLTFVALNSVRAKARDTKRIADIRQIQSALEIYKNDNGVYPPAGSVTSGQPLVANGQTYMAKIPTAPSARDGSCITDSYTYQSDSLGTTYGISYCLDGTVNNTGSGAGTAQPDKMFVSPVCPATTTTDIEGNIYNTVAIGEQCWLKQNLSTTKYNDGTSINNITDNGIWATTSLDSYANYDNRADRKTIYGCMYNWFAANSAHNLCPSGWRVPTDSDFQTMEMYLGFTSAEANTNGWIYNPIMKYKLTKVGETTGATNSSGFTSIEAGHRYGNSSPDHPYNGKFSDEWAATSYWTSTINTTDATKAVGRYMHSAIDGYYRGTDFSQNYGMYIRCIKN